MESIVCCNYLNLNESYEKLNQVEAFSTEPLGLAKMLHIKEKVKQSKSLPGDLSETASIFSQIRRGLSLHEHFDFR